MTQANASVRRPGVLQAALGVAAAAAIVAGIGFGGLRASVAHAPVPVLSEAERLGDALEQAPWIASSIDGPIIWGVTGIGCEGCAAFAAEDVPALEAKGIAVRVILVGQEGASVEALERAVTIARARAGADAPLEPGEAEGYLAWGRETLAEINAVVKANESDIALPMLIWKQRGAWMIAPGRSANTRARVMEDIKPAA
ncbi:MAG: hypothetical protein ABW199_02855 [Caulobacterales bacterium]